MPMRNPIPLALALALVSTGLQLAALFPEHTPQYWQLLVLIGIAGQLLAMIVVTGARRTRRAFAAVVQTDPLTQIGNRRRLQSLLGSGQSFLIIFIDLDHFGRFNTNGHAAGDAIVDNGAGIVGHQHVPRSADGLFELGEGVHAVHEFGGVGTAHL